MTPSAWLTAGLLVLGSGPLIYALARSRTLALSALDGFSCVAVSGLVLLHGLPSASEHAHWWAFVGALAGFLGPSAFERWRKRLARQAHAAATALALIGLAVHAFVDGSVLALDNDALALAVVLHRIAVSLAIWMLVLGQRSVLLRSTVLAAIGVATILGFGTGAALLGHTFWLGLLEGLVSGSLLHVVFHRQGVAAGATPRVRRLARPAAAAGALLGATLVACTHLLDSHVDHHGLSQATAELFIALAAKSAPPLLLAYLGAGLLDAFMPKGTVAWLRRGSPLSQSLRGVAFGLPLPVCSCGVIPLYRSLVLRGTPAAAGLTFLVATPEIGIDAVLLSLPLLGARFTLARVACATLVAIGTGWLVGRAADRCAPSTAPVGDLSAPSLTWTSRLRLALRSGFGDMVDDTAPWILLGLGIAAIGGQLADLSWLRSLPTPLGILFCALLGVPTYVCASGATPLVATLIALGLSPGAALAFLLTGPATNATTFGVLSQLHGRRIAALFGLTVASMAIALGLCVNLIVPNPDVFPLGHAAEPHHLGPLSAVSLVLLLGLYLVSLFRQGPRGFLARILSHEAAGDETDGHSDEHVEPSGGCCADDHDPGSEH